MYDNTPEQFARLLKRGHDGELRVALYYMLQGGHVCLALQGQREDLSVVMPDGDFFTVEVKWDRAAGKTGRLYLEVENTQRQRPSGVATSGARYWCHIIGDGREAILAPTTTLRKVLHRGRFRAVRTRGIDSNSRGFLVPREALECLKGVMTVQLPAPEEYFNC